MSKKKSAAGTVTAKSRGQSPRPANRVSSDPPVNEAADAADKNVRGAEASALAGAQQGTDPANAVADVDTSAINPPHPHYPPAIPGNTLAEAQAGDAARQAELKKNPSGEAVGENPARIPSRAAELAAAKKLPRARPPVPVEGEDAPARDLGPLVRVRATRMGFIDNVRRREGDVFDVHEAEYTDKWMDVVEGDVPLKVTSGKQELQKKHDEILGGRIAGRGGDPLGSATGEEALGEGRHNDPLGARSASARGSRA